MDQNAKHQNMNSRMEENWDADQEVYETSNKGTILEPRDLLDSNIFSFIMLDFHYFFVN
jgi:hypothetical protein